MRVGLTGATGHLGALLLGRLLAEPGVESVVSVARRPLAPALAADRRVVHVRADLRSDPARRALAGVDLCYHLGFQLWGRGNPASMADANLGGTANVLASGPGAVVLASSAAVYGAWPDNPLPLGEDHPPRPNPEAPYASHKLAAERLCLDAAPTVAVRLGAVLGAHAEQAVARSVAGYKLAVPAIRGAAQAVQFLDEADAVGALLAAGAALQAGGAARAGAVCNAATADWLGARDIAALSGGRVLALPRRPLLAASEAGRRARLLPFGADRAALLNGPLALDPARAAATLGWRPTRTSADVLREALRRAGPQRARW